MTAPMSESVCEMHAQYARFIARASTSGTTHWELFHVANVAVPLGAALAHADALAVELIHERNCDDVWIATCGASTGANLFTASSGYVSLSGYKS
jgi:hypothetical protein|tara:strand:- start:1334 stop:1618 length:285 start_codon:yes stop_codon:yes gene_type:complete